MKNTRTHRTLRWLLSVGIVALGLTGTWAWGQVARLAEPAEGAPEPQVAALYAAWQVAPSRCSGVVKEGQPDALHRSLDGGESWQPLPLPAGLSAVLWADDGRDAVAVAGRDGSLFVSRDQGEAWQQAALQAPVSSLTWDEGGTLYAGTRGQGIYRLGSDGSEVSITAAGSPLGEAPIVALDEVNGRLFAATPTTLYYTDAAAAVAGAAEWLGTAPVDGWITTLAAVDPDIIYAGTATAGVLLSTDAGQIWQPAREGLGLAAGQMVSITALRLDAREPGVLYAAVDHSLGATEVHSSAAGTFVSLDGGATWQPLAGPTFPEARHASALVTVPGSPLTVQAVTDQGLQAYEPDVAGALAALKSDDAATRAGAVRLLGLAQAKAPGPAGTPGAQREAGDELLAAVSDIDPGVSFMAGEALARLNDPATSSGLLVALEHPNERVRLVAAQTLGQMGVGAAVKPLRHMLFQGSGTEATIAGQALGRIAHSASLRDLGSPEAIAALLAALEEPVPTPLRSGTLPTSRWHAAMTGLEAAGRAAVGPLQELLDSRDVYVRRNAAEALGWIGSPDATSALVAALRDRDETVRSQAAWSLGIIGDPSAERALRSVAAGDPAPEVQAQASRALSLLAVGPSQTGRSWYVDWAPTLSRLEPARWLLLALSLAAAAWLMVGSRLPVPLLQEQRTRQR